MIDEKELLTLLVDMESFRVERTISTTDTQKFCEAICAFANDMAGARLPGFLFVGVEDKTGEPSGLVATDRLLQTLAGLSADGNILPPPAVLTYKIEAGRWSDRRPCLCRARLLQRFSCPCSKNRRGRRNQPSMNFRADVEWRPCR
jgi:hypothetical protein